jgi:osmoprotectant transport system permease protein
MTLLAAESLWTWVSTERSQVLSDLAQHIELTAIAVAFGLAISLPLGVVAWKVKRARGAVIGFSGAVYVVPSVAVMALMSPITGYFSLTTAEVALVGYTLLTLVRNIVTGLESVPAEAHEAARGMGYTPAGELWRVQLPLALPSVMAGLRVATVTVIGLVNVTAFVSQGGLGKLILEGFDQGYYVPIAVGLVLSVLLAAVADALFVALQRALLPWQRSLRRAAS